MAGRSGVFVYDGSRAAQPARARAFIDLAIRRLTDNPAYLLTQQELLAAESNGRAAHLRR